MAINNLAEGLLYARQRPTWAHKARKVSAWAQTYNKQVMLCSYASFRRVRGSCGPAQVRQGRNLEPMTYKACARRCSSVKFWDTCIESIGVCLLVFFIDCLRWFYRGLILTVQAGQGGSRPADCHIVQQPPSGKNIQPNSGLRYNIVSIHCAWRFIVIHRDTFCLHIKSRHHFWLTRVLG